MHTPGHSPSAPARPFSSNGRTVIGSYCACQRKLTTPLRPAVL